MIVTLKITLVRGRYCNSEWAANIELDESSTLVDLHNAIQRAVKFGDDHLYCFFVARTDHSQRRVFFDEDNGLIFSRTLKDMFPLPAKQSLYYLFDWGDDWVFKISPSRKRPHEPALGVTYPSVVGESGERPSQYPAYDEEVEE